MNIAEKIRIIKVLRGNMSERELAAKMGDTPQNLNNKMKRNDFKISELEKIAKALDCSIDIKFIDNTTGEEL